MTPRDERHEAMARNRVRHTWQPAFFREIARAARADYELRWTGHEDGDGWVSSITWRRFLNVSDIGYMAWCDLQWPHDAPHWGEWRDA